MCGLVGIGSEQTGGWCSEVNVMNIYARITAEGLLPRRIVDERGNSL
jgi:hypothetical protein